MIIKKKDGIVIVNRTMDPFDLHDDHVAMEYQY